MKHIAPAVVIGLTAVFIGLILSMQILTTSGSDQGGLVPLAKLKDYEQELKQVREEKEDALAELGVLQERLENIEKEEAADDTLIKGLVADIDKYKLAAGVTDVQGPGVVITIKNPESYDEYAGSTDIITYNYELLLSLVNKLKEAGAEAIAINEHRIVQTTEISLASNHININGNATAAPYYIKAIGNPTTMANALTIRGGVVETMRTNYGLSVELTKEEKVIIGKYTGVMNFKYADPVEAEAQ